MDDRPEETTGSFGRGENRWNISINLKCAAAAAVCKEPEDGPLWVAAPRRAKTEDSELRTENWEDDCRQTVDCRLATGRLWRRTINNVLTNRWKLSAQNYYFQFKNQKQSPRMENRVGIVSRIGDRRLQYIWVLNLPPRSMQARSRSRSRSIWHGAWLTAC